MLRIRSYWECRIRTFAEGADRCHGGIGGTPEQAEASDGVWQAVVVPAGTSKEIITLLNRAIVKIVALPHMQERMAALGYEPVGNKPEEFAAHIKSEIAKWGKVIRDAKIEQTK
jgi:Tripartite tricarboxylate transporter family receptor